MDAYFYGVHPDELEQVRSTSVDGLGHEVLSFVDDEGGWPLRCCLTDSAVGERLMIMSASPFPWTSPYREVGPVVVHAEECAGHDGRFPAEFEQRRQVVRGFGDDAGRRHVQVYDLHRIVEPGEGLQRAVLEVLADERVEFVQVHNVVSQCWSFGARRVVPT